MSTITCISEDRNIYRKGDITFEVSVSLQNTRVYITDDDGSRLLKIGRKEYEDVWWPRLQVLFPKLSSDTYFWERDTPNKGYVILYESSDPSSLYRTLNLLSDFNEFVEEPLAEGPRMEVAEFGSEFHSRSSLAKKFGRVIPH